MTRTSDARRCVGSEVHAKAEHVTSFKECQRLFGSCAKTKLVNGTVVELLKSTVHGRAKNELKVKWLVNDREIVKTLHLRSVRAGPVPSAPPPQRNPTTDTQTNDSGDDAEDDDEQPPSVEAAYSALACEISEAGGDDAASFDCHGVLWVKQEVQQPVGGPAHEQRWAMVNPAGELVQPGCDCYGPGMDRSPYDYFMTMFPQGHLKKMARLTSALLRRRGKPGTSVGELLRFFGVLVLATRYEFGHRSDLWATVAATKHLQAPAFGRKTGIPRQRFDSLWQCLTFSETLTADTEACSTRRRWSLVSDFVDAFNDHRAANFKPSDLICVDESMSRWYGQGGSWIDHGLPMYVAIDRKPENGCEIQTSACGRSGIMMRLHLVTTAEDEARRTTEGEQGLLHGTVVLSRLVSPWAGSGRTVCADSYFASVDAAERMQVSGMRFIGVVKTATRKYPMAELARRPVHGRGDTEYLVRKNPEGDVSMLALMWVDRERRYFISTTSTPADGTPYERVRWRQEGDAARRVVLTVRQPKVAEVYYSACASIDQHNRCRQDDLRLERKLVTHDWSKRVGFSILGIIIVDSWLLYNGRARAKAVHSAKDVRLPAVSAFGPRLTPTKKRKRSSFSAQRDCKVCKNRTTFVCSTCRETAGDEVFLCSAKKGRECFRKHQAQVHGISD
eukprot:IDg23220t1